MTSEDELELLRATVDGLFAERAPDLTTLGDLGLLSLLVPEDRGGAGWCPVEATVVAEAIGGAVASMGAPGPQQHGTSVPWLPVSVAAAALAMSDATADRLDGALDGSEPVVAVAGSISFDGRAASGTLVGVECADLVHAVVVLGESGSAHLVDLGPDVGSLRREPTSLDSTRPLWRVDLDGAPATELGRSTAVHDAARVLSAAHSLGSLRAALARLVPYLSDRQAFGAPIASFQAIQHRIVDLFLLEVRAGVAVNAAARALDADPAGGSWLAAVAHGFVAERIAPALDECIQLTGGIGFTWEYELHHELRRSVSDGVMFGSARASREELLETMGWG